MLRIAILLLGFLWANLSAQTETLPKEVRNASVYFPGVDNKLKLKYQYYYDFWSQQEIKHGTHSEWTSGGDLRCEETYVNGKLTGQRTVYHAQNKMRYREQLKNGYRHGNFERFNRMGKTKTVRPYVEGKIEGLVKHWYRNGQLKSAISYQEGRRKGVAVFYTSKGELKREHHFGHEKPPQKKKDKPRDQQKDKIEDSHTPQPKDPNLKST